MHHIIRSLGVIALMVGGAGCAGANSFPTARDFPPERGWASPLSRSETGPEVEALAARFYGDDFDREALARNLASLLQRHPNAWELHEMAAFLAELDGSPSDAWFHWMSAAADLRSPFSRLQLAEAFAEDLRVSEWTASVELLELLAAEHPDPSTRLDARRRLIQALLRFGRDEEARAAASELGFIDAWMVIGTFENDQGSGFRTRFPPEDGVDLEAEVQGMRLPARWRPVELFEETGLIPLHEVTSPDQWSVAYLAVFVHSDEARSGQLRLTSSTSVRAWVNGAPVASEELLSRLATDNVVVPIELDRGWNVVLIKSAQRQSDEWLINARITDEEGATLEGLRFSREPGEDSRPEPREGGEADPAPTPLPAALDAVTPPARREVLASRLLSRAGFDRRALQRAQAASGAAESNPVVLYDGALAHWRAEELGRTIDLLNRAVDATRGWGAGVLRARSRFYHERGLEDRALDDLQGAVETNPEARLARLDLAAAFDRRQWYEDRARVLAEVIERWPDNGLAIRQMSQTQEALGYIDRGERWARRAHALEPGLIWPTLQIVRFERQRHHFDRALGLLARLREIYPSRGELLLLDGDLHRRSGYRDEARAIFEEAARRDPGWDLPHEALANMAYEDGDEEAALAAWRRALEREPDDTVLAERIEYLEADQLESARRYVPTDEAIEALVASAGEVEVDPGAHTVMILDDEVTMVRGDGSNDRIVTIIQMAVNDTGRDQLTLIRVPATARILQAYSRSPAGERQEASSIRGGAVRFRRLDVGSVVVLQYVHHAAPLNFLPNHYASSWYFQGVERQAETVRWLLMLPRGRQLSIHSQGEIEHEHRTEGEWEFHTFTASHTPPLMEERYMPPAGSLIWHVSVSTVPSWDEYVQWELALLADVLESNAELRELALELTEGAATPRERFDRLYRYVSQEVRYQQDYEDTVAGVRPHAAPVVLTRGYGDCKDKAVLLILLAREVGLEVHFVLLVTKDVDEVEREVPNQQFNHAIVYVPAQEGIDEGFFMDPTTDGLDIGNLRADDQGAWSLVVDPERESYRFLQIPYQSPDMEWNRLEAEVRIESAERAAATATWTLRGAGASRLRRAMRNPEQRRMALESWGTAIFTGARLVEAEARHHEDIWDPLEMSFELDVAAAVQPQEGNLRIAMPERYYLPGMCGLERRRTPLRFEPPMSSSVRIRFVLPERSRVVGRPPEVEITHPCFTVTQHSQVSGREVTFEFDYVRTCTEISAEDYTELRALAHEAASRMEGHLVFRPR